jgi:hypothetical protein
MAYILPLKMEEVRNVEWRDHIPEDIINIVLLSSQEQSILSDPTSKRQTCARAYLCITSLRRNGKRRYRSTILDLGTS